MYTPTHYGKKISQLTEKENELLKTDMIMSIIFKKIPLVNNEVEKTMLSGLSSVLSNKRVDLCMDLLDCKEIHKDDEEDFMDYIETTQYGYLKFLSDVDKNIELTEKQERLSMLN